MGHAAHRRKQKGYRKALEAAAVWRNERIVVEMGISSMQVYRLRHAGLKTLGDVYDAGILRVASVKGIGPVAQRALSQAIFKRTGRVW